MHLKGGSEKLKFTFKQMVLQWHKFRALKLKTIWILPRIERSSNVRQLIIGLRNDLMFAFTSVNVLPVKWCQQKTKNILAVMKSRSSTLTALLQRSVKYARRRTDLFHCYRSAAFVQCLLPAFLEQLRRWAIVHNKQRRSEREKTSIKSIMHSCITTCWNSCFANIFDHRKPTNNTRAQRMLLFVGGFCVKRTRSLKLIAREPQETRIAKSHIYAWRGKL